MYTYAHPQGYYFQQGLVPDPQLFPSLPVDRSLEIPKTKKALYVQQERFSSTFSLWSVRGVGVGDGEFIDYLESRMYSWQKQRLAPKLRKKDNYCAKGKGFVAFVEFPGYVDFGKALAKI